MSTAITLDIAGVPIDWGAGFGFRSHTALFQGSDLQRSTTDDGACEEFYQRPLRRVVRRLELLGHTLERIQAEFPQGPAGYDFDWLARALKRVSLSRVAGLAWREDDCLSLPQFACLLRGGSALPDDFGELLDLEQHLWQIDPYSILRLLAENSDNLDKVVEWRFSELVEAGYAHRDDFTCSPPERFVILTEGKSDVGVLRKAINFLEPDVADFFKFLDVYTHYPFASAARLAEFCKGLAHLPPRQTVIALFDNDAEGVAQLAKLSTVTLPPSVRPLKLPELPEFREFKTIGPTGEAVADINGRAAALECYLDLTRVAREPVVRWSSYNDKAEAYQGALENKEAYTKAFHALRDPEDGYDFSKLRRVVDAIIKRCVE